MQVRLLVLDPKGRWHPVEVFVPAKETVVGDLCRAICHSLGLEGEYSLAPFDESIPLSWESTLRESGLLEGDRLVIVPEEEEGWNGRRDQRMSSSVELVVVGGPRQGRRIRLSNGSFTVGRAADCTVQIEDDAISGHHLEVTVDASDQVTVRDLGSKNGTFIAGVRLREPKVVGNEVIEVGGTLLRLEPARATVRSPAPSGQRVGLGREAFNRPPRTLVSPDADDWIVPTPPEDPGRIRIPIGATIVPLLLGVVLFLVVKQATMLLFMALTPVMAIWNVIENKSSSRKNYRRELADFRRALDALAASMMKERQDEATDRAESSPSASVITGWAVDRSVHLWNRRPSDPDFLSLRIGWTDLPSRRRVRFPESGAKSLIEQARKRLELLSTIPSVPFHFSLEDKSVVGVAGHPEWTHHLGRWLISQLVGMQSPNDVTLCACISSQHLEEWSWLSWLPHIRSGLISEESQFVSDHKDSRELLSDVSRLIRRREESAKGLGGQRERYPRVIVLIDEHLSLDRSAVTDILEAGPENGVFTVWIGTERHLLPGQCRVEIDLSNAPGTVVVGYSSEGTKLEIGGVEGLESGLCLELALALAPLIDVGKPESDAELPNRLSLLEALGEPELHIEAVLMRWAGSEDSLSGLIGISSAGEIRLDLRVDGPHALVGGTTGSGKSEFLRTFVAALAIDNPPNRLNFILIDYKGGAAFKECVDLPHTVGYVTDLDGHLAKRALVSLEAELKRRERLLREFSCRDLIDMEESYPENSPPSILIVIDEFAALAKELPEFVEGVVDISQRGRSLGVHLLLATQRPAGVITDAIRANTNIRVALRMNDLADSNDVINVDQAARLSKSFPGRGYVRTGHGELVLIQTAYASGMTARPDDQQTIVRELDSLGRPKSLDRPEVSPSSQSDLEAVVKVVSSAWNDRGGPVPRAPWTEPLPNEVGLESLARVSANALEKNPFRIPVGIVDLPRSQIQETYFLSLDEGSVAIFGAGGTGKSSILRTIAVSLCLGFSATQVNIYALDMTGRSLGILENFHQVGAVLTASDQERIIRLLTDLERELEKRKSLFATNDAMSLRELQQSNPRECPPRTVVLLDGYSGFVSAVENVEFGRFVDLLPRLITEGRALGIHFVITAERRGSLSGSLTGIIPTKVVLRMADPDEYSALGLRSSELVETDLPPGRGIVDGTTEVQFAVVGDAPGHANDSLRIARYVEDASEIEQGAAPPVRLLPTKVPIKQLLQPADRFTVAIGLRNDTLSEATIDLSMGSFLICGPLSSGRTTALGTVAEGIVSIKGATACLLAPRPNVLTSAPFWGLSATSIEDSESVLRRISDDSTALATPDRPLFIFIDDAEDLFDFAASIQMMALLRRSRNEMIRFVVAAESHSTARGFGWISELRKERRGLLLVPDLDLDGDLFGVRLPRWPNTFPHGRGYLVSRGGPKLIQVATDDQD